MSAAPIPRLPPIVNEVYELPRASRQHALHRFEEQGLAADRVGGATVESLVIDLSTWLTICAAYSYSGRGGQGGVLKGLDGAAM